MAARRVRFGLVSVILTSGLVGGMAAGRIGDLPTPPRWRQHDIHRPRPPVVEPAAAGSTASVAPQDAVVLFDGAKLDAWQTSAGGPAGWMVKDGYLEVVPGSGSIQTKAEFGDIQLHVEWAAPDPPVGKGQDRGNSGIFLMGQFEIQVIDSYKADTYADGQVGAIYGQYPPLFNAARPPGQWQSYDIAFRRPRFDETGKLLEPARLTVFLNGILVQNNEQPWGQTSWLEPTAYDPTVLRGPIQLQDHDHRVRFRNIWLRNLLERPAPTADDLKHPDIITLTPEALDAYTGRYEAGPEPGALRLTLKQENGHLLLTLPFRSTPLPLEPVSDTLFVMPHTDARFIFQKDEQGRVTGALFQVGDVERKLRRARE
ncbi:MAG: family 16 glycoside hydrolase [Isosphaeraceae bacterium]